MAAPCALVASCSKLEPKELVRRVIGVDKLPDGKSVVEEVQAYPWHVDTKYYTADIHLCTTNVRTIGNQEFADSVQAFIVHFDTSQNSSLDQVKLWLPFLREIEPAVQMLVCDRCTQDDAVKRSTVLAWCLENSFELVELDPVDDSDSDSEDDFKETTGISRVIQALHAHTWPNLVMKDNPNFRSPYMNKMMAEEAMKKQAELDDSETRTSNSSVAQRTSLHDNHCSIDKGNTVKKSDSAEATNMTTEVNSGAVENSCVPSSSETDSGCSGGDSNNQIGNKKHKEEKHGTGLFESMIKDDDLSLFAAVGNEDPDNESFEQLFERMKIMKETAASLPPDQRKLYAEQVAISFWRAIGGDEEEIEGLSNSDEHED